MYRTLAVASALMAAALSTHSLAAQSTASSPSKPALHQAPVRRADSAGTSATADAPRMRHAAWTKDQVKEAQQGLAKAGLYKGEATGVWNQDSKKALRAYQKQNKLPVTGRLSDSVLVKLKSV